MRFSMLMLAVAGACLVQAQPKGGAAPADTVGGLKVNYTANKTKVIAAAEEMPEAGYSFQPTPEERNFGAWVAHLADAQAQFCGNVTGDVKKLDAASKTAKADLVAALKASYDICDAAYDGTTAANANDTATTFRGPQTRVTALWMNTAHNEEGYGSMAVYLRLQKLVPPSSQGRGGAGKGKAKQ
jgi:DinB family protein